MREVSVQTVVMMWSRPDLGGWTDVGLERTCPLTGDSLGQAAEDRDLHDRALLCQPLKGHLAQGDTC